MSYKLANATVRAFFPPETQLLNIYQHTTVIMAFLILSFLAIT